MRLSEDESYTQERAGEYCRALGAQWRLMQIDELFALPDSTPYKNDFSYWSSNQTASDNSEIGTGSEGDGGKTPMLGYSFYPKERNVTLSPGWKRIAAACINEPYVKRQRHYGLRPDGTEDPFSQIIWHNLDSTDKRAKYTFEEAKNMCDNLTLFGHTWRLPTTKELYGIVDYDFTRPTVDMKYFGTMMHRYYWSSDVLNEREAYVVGFKLGGIATAPKKASAHARCVSDIE